MPEAKPPPFGKGGFGLCFHYHRTNDTGHRRGSNDLLKITVRNRQRRLAADTGHWRGSNDLLKIIVRIATGGTPALKVLL